MLPTSSCGKYTRKRRNPGSRGVRIQRAANPVFVPRDGNSSASESCWPGTRGIPWTSCDRVRTGVHGHGAKYGIRRSQSPPSDTNHAAALPGRTSSRLSRSLWRGSHVPRTERRSTTGSLRPSRWTLIAIRHHTQVRPEKVRSGDWHRLRNAEAKRSAPDGRRRGVGDTGLELSRNRREKRWQIAKRTKKRTRPGNYGQFRRSLPVRRLGVGAHLRRVAPAAYRPASRHLGHGPGGNAVQDEPARKGWVPMSTKRPGRSSSRRTNRKPDERRGPDGRFRRAPGNTRLRVCDCSAYSWPHRAGGGLWRWPESPAEECPTPASTNRTADWRRRGLRAFLMKRHGLHPIRDRALIRRVLPTLYWHAQRGDYPSMDEVLRNLGRNRSC
jgi:hypothetical protein